MPITGIFWNGNTGRDIHILRGGGISRDLTHQSLAFVKADGSTDFADDYLAAADDVTLTFAPLFHGAMQPDGIHFAGEDNGITVNTRTGEVSVDAAVPAYPKNNFIIEVNAQNDADVTIFEDKIRVQVHGSVTQVWLKPDQVKDRPPLSVWGTKSSYTVGESLVDSNQILQIVTGVTGQITNVAISDNVLTLTVNQNFAEGAGVTISDLTVATFLNGQQVEVVSATATQVTANFTHADFDSADTGTAVADAGSGSSGDGPGPPAFANVENQTVTDNQVIWTSQGNDWTLHTDYRFSLRAQFDDGVVGDLTENHDVTWNDVGGHLEIDGRISVLPGDNPGDKFFVGATLPAALGGATTPLGFTVEIASKWADEPSPPKVTIVAGGGLPASGTAEDSPNILMLSDGFRLQDQDSFDQIVDT